MRINKICASDCGPGLASGHLHDTRRLKRCSGSNVALNKAQHHFRLLSESRRAGGARLSAPVEHLATQSLRGSKEYDVVALGNLCVDVVVSFEELPDIEEVKRPAMLERLTAEAAEGDTQNWEAGAQSNFMIAAARLGLRVASAANVGPDVYGNFLRGILHEEGVLKLEPLSPSSFQETLKQTLICFVLVNPQGQHHFCSRYDFGPWPLLAGVDSLPPGVLKMLDSTEALFVNGFIFDELPISVVMSAVVAARQSGAATFFDPGPRAWTLRLGERKKGLDAMLDASDVVLMTQEEAEAVTGHSDAEQAAISILERPGAHTEWCVVKLGPQGALIRTKSPPQTLHHSALQVDVQDTVGCGDSFAAGIVLGYIQKQPLRPVLALSNAVGAATATSPGAGRNVASADTVRSLLSRQASSSDSNSSDGMGEEEWAIRIAEVEVSQGARSQAVEAYVSERQQAASKDQQPLNGGPNVALQALRLLDSTAQAE